MQLGRAFARLIKLTSVFTKNLVGVTNVEEMATVVDQLTNEVNDGSGTTWNDDSAAVDLGGRIERLAELFGYSVYDQLKVGRLLPTFSINGGIARGGIKYQSDGKIIVIGKFTSVNGNTKWRYVVRFNTDYSIDETFNPPVIGTYHGDGIQCGDVDADDKILIGGAIASVDGDTTWKNLIRLNADGTHDTTFAKATASNSGWPHAVHVGASGRIGVAGRLDTWIGASGPIKYAIILENNGTPVVGFQSQGTGFDSLCWSCRLQDDDKLLVGGQAVSYNGVQSRALARLNIDGTLDTTFSSNMGDGFRNSTDSNMDVWAIELGYDDNGDPVIFCGGDFWQFNLENVGHLIALNPDGTKNTVFQTGTGINGGVYEIVWDEWWWGVWAGGSYSQYNGQNVNDLVLINPDGELIEEFYSQFGGTVYAIGRWVAHPFDSYLPGTLLCGKSTSSLSILNYDTGSLEYGIRAAYLVGDSKLVLGNARLLNRAQYWKEPAASTSDLDILSKGELAEFVAGERDIVVDGQPYTAKDWFQDSFGAGRVWGGNITPNGDGTVAITEGEGLVHTVSGDLTDCPCNLGEASAQLSPMKRITWAAVPSLALTDNAYNFIYVDGLDGLVKATTDFYSISFTSAFTIGRAYRIGNTTIARLCGTNVWNFTRRVQLFGEEVFPIRRASGLLMADATNRQFTVTSGILWAELLNRFPVGGKLAATNFTYWWRNGSGGWNSTSQNQISNTQFDNGTGTLANFGGGPNHWRADFVYAVHDGTYHVVYGQTDFTTVAAARLASPPATLPGLLAAYASLLGRVIIQKNLTALELASAFDTVFTPVGVVSHNDTSGLQGGVAGEYYHLTLDQYNRAIREVNFMFVDADFGSDVTGDGSETNPYQTVQRAWNERIATSTSRQQYYKILCKGIGNPALVLTNVDIEGATQFEGVGSSPNITIQTTGVTDQRFIAPMSFLNINLVYDVGNTIGGDPLLSCIFDVTKGSFSIEQSRKIFALYLYDTYYSSTLSTDVLSGGYLQVFHSGNIEGQNLPVINVVNAYFKSVTFESPETFLADGDNGQLNVRFENCISANKNAILSFQDDMLNNINVSIRGGSLRYDDSGLSIIGAIDFNIVDSVKRIRVQNSIANEVLYEIRDNNSIIEVTNTGGIVLPDGFAKGFSCEVVNIGSADIEIFAVSTLIAAENPTILAPYERALVYCNGANTWVVTKGGGGGGALVIEELALPVTTGNLTLAFDTPTFYTPYGATATGIINFILDNTDAVVGTTKRVEIDFAGYEPTFGGVAWDDVTQTKFRFLAGFPDNTAGLINILEFRWITTDKVDVVVAYI